MLVLRVRVAGQNSYHSSRVVCLVDIDCRWNQLHGVSQLCNHNVHKLTDDSQLYLQSWLKILNTIPYIAGIVRRYKISQKHCEDFEDLFVNIMFTVGKHGGEAESGKLNWGSKQRKCLYPQIYR